MRVTWVALGAVVWLGPGPAQAEPRPLAKPDPAKAIAAGLKWLAKHQDEDGTWSCVDFEKRCAGAKCGGKGADANYDPGTTGLACLAFLAAGHTPKAGEHKAIVEKGIARLVRGQNAEGCLAVPTKEGHFIYPHLYATRAVCEAAGATGDAALLEAATKAVRWTEKARNPELGWRYGVQPKDNDTSVTGLAVLALAAGKAAGIEVDEACFTGAAAWFNKVTNAEWGKTGYTQNGDNGARLPEAQAYAPTESMTALALAARLRMGEKVESAAVTSGLALLVNLPPVWAPKDGNDFYYWQYGTIATSLAGGAAWDLWKARAVEALVAGQRKGTHADGSWDPCDAWGTAGGRIYSTAMNLSTLALCGKPGKPPRGK